MNLERSNRTNQDRPAIRFPRKSARSNLARCVRERSWDDVQWCSKGKVLGRPWQECHDVPRSSSRIHRLYKSLFKNAPLLTFLSADLFPFKHARMFLTKFPNSFPGRSVTVNLERILMFHMRFQVNNILKFQDCKQVPREECTYVPVQKSNTHG